MKRTIAMLRILPLALAAAALACAGCNSYDPSLPDQPFRCGMTDPRCPDGYQCVHEPSGLDVCERGSGSAPDATVAATDAAAADAALTDALVTDAATGDGGSSMGADGGSGFHCNSDSNEPNNSNFTSTVVPIPPLTDYSDSGAICPATDDDYFAFDVANEGETATADVTYQSAQGALALEMQNSSGNPIMQGTQVTANDLQVMVASLPTGVYYVHVSSKSGAENNYNLEIKVSGP